jgi:hypothetical protein
MKRWQLTAGLVALAGTAALLAPRIQGLTATILPANEVVEIVAIEIEEIPEILLVPEIEETSLEMPVESNIPELVNTPVQPPPPVEKPPILKIIDTFWDDCPGCGMG